MAELVDHARHGLAPALATEPTEEFGLFAGIDRGRESSELLCLEPIESRRIVRVRLRLGRTRPTPRLRVRPIKEIVLPLDLPTFGVLIIRVWL